MPQNLAGRIALVTGASRGIGYALSLALARAGAHIVAIGRTVGALEELDDALRAAGATMTGVPLDMRDYPALYRLATTLNERYQRLDVLVGNAAVVGPRSPLRDVDTSTSALNQSAGMPCRFSVSRRTTRSNSLRLRPAELEPPTCEGAGPSCDKGGASLRRRPNPKRLNKLIMRNPLPLGIWGEMVTNC